MQPETRDMARLWDMLDAARTTIEFTVDLRFEHFLRDRKTLNAVERNLEIVGEAARHVSLGAQAVADWLRNGHPGVKAETHL